MNLDISVATVGRALSKRICSASPRCSGCARRSTGWAIAPLGGAEISSWAPTRIIYVVIPSLGPFFLEIFRGIERAALELGYSAVIGHTGRDPAREGQFFDQVACGRAPMA